MSNTISIQVFNNSVSLSGKNVSFKRQNNENIENWINRSLDDLVTDYNQNIFFDISYPVNPLIENINLTKLISMQAITKIAEISNLNIVNQSIFGEVKNHNYYIDIIYVVGGLRGDLNAESQRLAKNLKLTNSEKIHYFFSGNEDLKNNICWPTKPILIPLDLEKFINDNIFKQDLINASLMLSSSLEFIFYNKIFYLLSSNKKLKSKSVSINYRSINENLGNLKIDGPLILVVMKNGATILKKSRPYNQTILGYPFLGTNIKNKFIFIWLIQYFDKFKLLGIISNNSPEKTYIDILEETIDNDLIFWLNISFILFCNKFILNNVKYVIKDNKSYSKNSIFKNLLNYFKELELK